MNAKKYSFEPEYAANGAPKPKTVALQVGVADPNLEATIKTAFALAKSAGRELDLRFQAEHPGQNTFGQLRAG